VNKDGMAYNMAGLFAVGEAACWDMHGFNRLGGNSLAETIVAGRIVGSRVAEFAAGHALRGNAADFAEALSACEQQAAAWQARKGNGPGVFKIRDAMGEIMMNKVGIFRNGAELREAVAGLQELLEQCDAASLRSNAAGANPELTFALRLKGMLRLATTIAMGALARTESRGAHCRSDYPLRDDKHWLNRTLVRWPESDDQPSFSYEPVGLLDLPPGHRGYGSDQKIPMQASIEEYNASVLEAQTAQGRLPSAAPIGSRLHERRMEASQ
jgi:fumarate reductase flavoprotein subunit